MMQQAIAHANELFLPISCSFLKNEVSVEIPANLVDQLFDLAALTQQEYIRPIGFPQGKAPLSYIKEFHKEPLLSHLKQFLLNYRVLPFLIEQLITHKVPFIGTPKLTTITLSPGHKAFFTFEIQSIEPIHIQDWKYFSFKAPKRKNYKDLDKQVEYFLGQESKNQEEAKDVAIGVRDWVQFCVTLLDYNKQPVADVFSQTLWFKIGDEEVESPLKDALIGKHRGDTFVTDNKGLQDFFSTILQTHYLFSVTILDILPDAYFDTELFKKYFRLKTGKDLHKKLIEVFSFRNDISQRRSTVEEVLALLIAKHNIVAPQQVIQHQKEKLLRAMRENPDYTVYLRQRDFEQKLNELAQRQAREIMFIDQFAYKEDLHVSHDDIKGYLNLTKRNRMKDFLYFDIPDSTQNGHEVPLSVEELYKTCLREKAINHAIYHLTKK